MSFRQRSVTYVKSFLRAFTREKRYPTCFKFRFVSSPLDAYLRSVPDALARSGSKLRQAVKDNALASVTLQHLLETGQVIEFKYKKQRLCLHSAHFRQQSAQVCHSQETLPDLDHDLSLQEVHQVYARVRGRQLGSAVFISDLATELKCQPRVRKNDRFSEPGCHLILLRGTFEIER